MNTARPRILLVSPHCPYARPSYGAQMRTLQIGRILQQYADVRLVLTPLLCDPLEPKAIERTREQFSLEGVLSFEARGVKGWRERWQHEFSPRYLNTHGLVLSSADREGLRALAAQHDLVWFQTIVVPNATGILCWPRSVVDVDDVPSRFQRSALAQETSWLARLLTWRRIWLWKRRERILLNRFGILTVCSDSDRQYLGGDERIHVVPNGFQPAGSTVARCPATPPRLGFIGLLRYPPNLEGLRWFAKQVWPWIKKVHPTARLRLIGSGTDEEARRLGPDVDGLGWVQDPAPEMASWSGMIVPIQMGGGTRVKIAEGFSRECPVVATRLGAFGYAVQSGVEILLADDPAAFAQACLSLLSDPELGARLAANALAKYRRHWTWEAIAPQVGAAMEHALRHTQLPALAQRDALERLCPQDV